MLAKISSRVEQVEEMENEQDGLVVDDEFDEPDEEER